MPVQGVRMFDWKGIESLVERSHQYALAALKGFLDERRRAERPRSGSRIQVRPPAPPSPTRKRPAAARSRGGAPR
jgi:hypothetical protein